jgi:predicted ATPase
VGEKIRDDFFRASIFSSSCGWDGVEFIHVWSALAPTSPLRGGRVRARPRVRQGPFRQRAGPIPPGRFAATLPSRGRVSRFIAGTLPSRRHEQWATLALLSESPALPHLNFGKSCLALVLDRLNYVDADQIRGGYNLQIRHIKIDKWRHFEKVEFSLPDGAPIICIVGGNGTGKSQILELIASCAQRIGLTPGTENQRGDPFSEDAEFEVHFFIAPNTVPNLEGPHRESHQSDYSTWNRMLILRKDRWHGVHLHAGGLDSGNSTNFAQYVVSIIQASSSIHYLSLDADRAYPKIEIHSHQMSEVLDRDWASTNKQSSFRITKNLYEEWFRFLIGSENQENNKHVQEIRISRDTGRPDPKFVDQFESYKNSVKKILPHLLFLGVDSKTRRVKFDSTGTPLTFDQLSGGEREIAFLVGQIERFSLKKGLLLVDEPELHLNYDLLRSWIGFLKDSVDDGQIWLATHSLEVVEVAGQDATVILQRDEHTRRVVGVKRLSQQPVVATLSRAIGSPAFSISSLSFVLIEGEEEIGERERFRLLCNIPPHVRFLEAGSCKEVIRRMQGLKDLAAASGQEMRIGGVVDRDWRSKLESDELVSQGLFVLGVHEVENFFIHPPTLTDFLVVNGGDPNSVEPILKIAMDRRAGSWIFNSARTDRKFRDYPEPSKTVRELVHKLTWSDFADTENACHQIANAHGDLSEDQIIALAKHIQARATIFARRREDGSMWRSCEGKEVFRSIIGELGLTDEDHAERALSAVWVRQPNLIPVELTALRAYIRSL